MNTNANVSDSNINLSDVGMNWAEMANRFGEYFIENITGITIIIIVIVGALVYQQIMYVQHDIDGSKPISKKSQTVIVETFDNANANAKTNTDKMNSMLQAGFCKMHLGKPAELETACGELSKSSCTATSCCVWSSLDSKESCMSGNQNGPIFKNGKTLDYYYFENKCNGNCPGSAEK